MKGLHAIVALSWVVVLCAGSPQAQGADGCASQPVSELLAASTSAADDSDHDGLPDRVEMVLGTYGDLADSDFDDLGDYDEVCQKLSDPLEPDSNADGLPDAFEVAAEVPDDADGDGVPNLRDPDNDGDGVLDGVELSPFAQSSAGESLAFEIPLGASPT